MGREWCQNADGVMPAMMRRYDYQERGQACGFALDNNIYGITREQLTTIIKGPPEVVPEASVYGKVRLIEA